MFIALLISTRGVDLSRQANTTRIEFCAIGMRLDIGFIGSFDDIFAEASLFQLRSRGKATVVYHNMIALHMHLDRAKKGEGEPKHPKLKNTETHHEQQR